MYIDASYRKASKVRGLHGQPPLHFGACWSNLQNKAVAFVQWGRNSPFRDREIKGGHKREIQIVTYCFNRELHEVQSAILPQLVGQHT